MLSRVCVCVCVARCGHSKTSPFASAARRCLHRRFQGQLCLCFYAFRRWFFLLLFYEKSNILECVWKNFILCSFLVENERDCVFNWRPLKRNIYRNCFETILRLFDRTVLGVNWYNWRDSCDEKFCSSSNLLISFSYPHTFLSRIKIVLPKW